MQADGKVVKEHDGELPKVRGGSQHGRVLDATDAADNCRYDYTVELVEMDHVVDLIILCRR